MFMLDRHGKQRVKQTGLTTQAAVRIADSPPFTGRFAGFALAPQYTSARELKAGASRVATPATRNTFFLSQSETEGKAYHLAGELEIVVKVRRVRAPGPLLHAAPLTAVRRGMEGWDEPRDPFARHAPHPHGPETRPVPDVPPGPPAPV